MLKKGDMVVMHTCVEAENPKYFGKIWTCMSDEFTTGEGIYEQKLVFLEGYSSSFLTKFLQKVDVQGLAEEKERYRKALEQIHKLSSYYEDDASMHGIAQDALGCLTR